MGLPGLNLGWVKTTNKQQTREEERKLLTYYRNTTSKYMKKNKKETINEKFTVLTQSLSNFFHARLMWAWNLSKAWGYKTFLMLNLSTKFQLLLKAKIPTN